MKLKLWPKALKSTISGNAPREREFACIPDKKVSMKALAQSGLITVITSGCLKRFIPIYAIVRVSKKIGQKPKVEPWGEKKRT